MHLYPGDELILTLNNGLPPSSAPMTMAGVGTVPKLVVSPAASMVCGSSTMTAASVNLHYHGANISPMCHQDDVISTLINSRVTFTYDIHFPIDEPPDFTGIIRTFMVKPRPPCSAEQRAPLSLKVSSISFPNSPAWLSAFLWCVTI